MTESVVELEMKRPIATFGSVPFEEMNEWFQRSMFKVDAFMENFDAHEVLLPTDDEDEGEFGFSSLIDDPEFTVVCTEGVKAVIAFAQENLIDGFYEDYRMRCDLKAEIARKLNAKQDRTVFTEECIDDRKIDKIMRKGEMFGGKWKNIDFFGYKLWYRVSNRI